MAFIGEKPVDPALDVGALIEKTDKLIELNFKEACDAITGSEDWSRSDVGAGLSRAFADLVRLRLELGRVTKAAP